MVIGKCPTCGESIFGDFDYQKNKNHDKNDRFSKEFEVEKENIIDCPKKECEAQLLFKDEELSYKGNKPKPKEEPAKKETPKEEPTTSSAPKNN